MEQAELKTNIVIFGKNGQISSKFNELFKLEEGFSVTHYSSKDIDFSDLIKLELFLEKMAVKPSFIINCAAYTNVDKAEDEKELADIINHKAVAIIANYCKKHDVKLIHYSTDYVFDGSGDQAFTEDNAENLHPINHYGKTKLSGEKAILKSGCDYLIFRISWIYNTNPTSKNFVNTIKRLAKEKEALEIIDDQIGSPTSSDFVASNTIRIIKKIKDSNQDFPNGTYHLNNGRFISWYRFAVDIIDDLKRSFEILKVKKINTINSSQYVTKAVRPLNSRLDNSKVREVFGLDFNELQKKYLAVFAHYDSDKIIDDYVLYYLRGLKKVAKEIIFVSDCDLPKNEVDKLSDLCIHVIVGRHGEYDFGSYKRGIQYAKSQNIIQDYDSLIIANDSCYGPIKSLSPVFQAMELRDCDFWGMTLNTDGYAMHVQSYFVTFNKKVFLSDIFNCFFDEIQAQNSKTQIIEKYEIGLTSLLLFNHFKVSALIKFVYDRNPTVSNKLFTELLPLGFPFIKIELMHKNPLNIKSLNHYKDYVQRNLIELIEMHKINKNSPIAKIRLVKNLLKFIPKVRILKILLQIKHSKNRVIIKFLKIPIIYLKPFKKGE